MKNIPNPFKLLLVFIFIIPLSTLAQTPGLIFRPATGAGKAVLDPNGDGHTSATTTGFTTDDRTQSEIPFVPLVFPMLEPTGDLGPGPDCSFTDFVDSGSEDPALSYFDGTNLLFRMRLGKAFPNSKGYSVLIDTDQKFGSSGPNADPNATATNPGFEIEINLQTNFGVFVYNVDGICPGGPSSSFAGETNYQKSVALTTNCGDPDYFYDFYVPFSSLTALGITASTPLRMAIVTQMNPQPGICNNALSDFGGIDDNTCGGSPFTCWNTIIDNYPPTSVTNINTPAGDRSLCPTITSPIAANATSVSGTSTEASGTTVKVYKNGFLIGSTTTSGAAWALSGISPALVSGDIITATATAPGESESIANCNPVTVAVTCTSPIASVTACNANKAFSGTGTPGALIKLYYGSSTTPLTPTSGNLFSTGTITVDNTGAWLWRCVGSGQTTSCSAGGGPCLADGLYRITQTLSGQCESLPTYICIGGGAATATPTITTSPILTSTTTVAGTSVASASIILYEGTTQIGTTTASAGGVWSIAGLSPTFGQVLTAKAISSTLCLSAASASVTVTRNTVAPIVTGTYCTTSTINSVSGTSAEAAGTIIQVFKNGIAHGSTTTVAANGTWIVSTGISFVPSDIISAKATITGGIQSAFSNTITVAGKTTTTATVTTSPIIESSSAISGTGTNGNVIRLYIDGVQTGGTATVASGVWTIGSLGTYDLYAGGLVTATATAAGSCESDPSAGITVQCLAPLTSLTVDPPSTSVCSGSVIASGQVLSSQNFIIYQLYNGASPSGSSVLGTGGTITLTSAVLTASTTLTVKAIKIGGVTCESFLTDNIPVTVNSNPTLSLTVTAATGSVCQGSGSAIDISLSQSGFSYQLRNDADNSLIGSAVSGTGGTISLLTGNLSGTSTFNVLVTGVAPSNCSGTLTTKPTVTVIPPPDAALAGSNQTICSSTGTTTMSGNSPSTGTGAWSFINGPSTPSITTASDPLTSITDLTTAGTYTFQWTINNAPCTASSDLVDIIVTDGPTTANAGSNQAICSTGSASLAANNPAVGTGLWSISSGPSTAPAQFSDVTNRLATFTPSGGAGNYVLVWTISNTTCTASTSSINVVVTASPSTPTISSTTQPNCAVPSGTIVFNAQAGVEYGIDGVYQASETFSGLIPDTYTLGVRSATNNTCITNAASTVTINAIPNATISYAGTPFSASLVTPQSVALTGTAGGTFSSTVGLSINAVNGDITPSTSTAGTYIVSYTISGSVCATTSITIDNTLPSVDILSEPVTVNTTAPYTVTIEFSENVTGFVIGDISVGNGSASNFVAVDGNTYTVDITPSGAGNITIDVAAGVAQDAAASTNTAATQAVTIFDSGVPSVDILGELAIVNSTTPYPVTIQFSEDVTGFVIGDISVGNGSASNFVAVDGNTYTVDITPSGVGNITIDVAAGVAQDAAANTNTAATQAVTIFNSGLPSVDILGEPAIVNSTTPYTVTIQFSEDVTGFVIGDISVGNGSASNFVAVDGNTYTVDITPSGAGNITIDVAAGVAQDAAANTNTAATQAVTIFDSGVPSVDILGEPAIVNSTTPYTVTIQFSEDVTGFVIGDISVGNGSASNFVAVDGNTYTVDITPSGAGNITIDVAAGVAQDAAANTNTAAIQAVTIFDNTKPSVDIQGEPAIVNSTTPYTVTIQFNEDVTGFVIGDISVGNGSASNFVAVDGNRYTVDITPSGAGNITIDVAAGVAQDAAANTNTAATQAVTIFNSGLPSVDILGEPAIVNSTTPYTVTIQFSEDVTGFVIGDISVGNGSASNFVAVDGNTYTVDITPSGAGNITIDVAAGVAQDAAANNNTAAAQAVTIFDSGVPSVDILGEPAIVNNTTPYTVTIQFSEDVTGFVIGDISVGNGSASNFVAVDGNTYTVDITPTGAGNITIDVAAGVAQDAAANTNTAAIQAVTIFDNTKPSVDIQGEPAIINSTTPYTVTIQFSEDVTGFVIGDISVGNGSASNFVAVDGNTYTVDITPSGAGNITIDVAAGVAQDAAANNNTAAAQAVTVFNTDNEALYTIAPAQNIDNYVNGNTLATVSDADGAITSAVVSTGTLPSGTSINATTGTITVTDNTLLVAGTYTFSVTTTDATGGTTTQPVTITFIGNSPPTVAGATVSLDENSVNGTVVHQVIASDIDPDDILTYSIISGNSSSAFSINPNTGEIVVNNRTAVDFETNPVFTLTVQVTDSQGNTSTAIVIITLIDSDNEDTDGDGIPDFLEKKSGNPMDTDGDGIPDFKDPDDDNDGKPTIDEDNNKDGNYFNDDCDNDGVPDYLDSDQCKIKPSLGFSPNGDGNSDVWIIDFIEDYPNNTVKIFNRWGNQVYETNGYNNTENVWDGQSNGKLTIGDFSSPDGTYFYVIDLGDGSKPIGGYVIIKR